MEQELALQLGVGGTLAYLLVREILNFLKVRMGPNTAEVAALEGLTKALTELQAIGAALREQTEQLRAMREESRAAARQVSDVHEWLSATDADGVKKVYGRDTANAVARIERKIGSDKE